MAVGLADHGGDCLGEHLWVTKIRLAQVRRAFWNLAVAAAQKAWLGQIGEKYECNVGFGFSQRVGEVEPSRPLTQFDVENRNGRLEVCNHATGFDCRRCNLNLEPLRGQCLGDEKPDEGFVFNHENARFHFVSILQAGVPPGNLCRYLATKR